MPGTGIHRVRGPAPGNRARNKPNKKREKEFGVMSPMDSLSMCVGGSYDQQRNSGTPDETYAEAYMGISDTPYMCGARVRGSTI